MIADLHVNDPPSEAVFKYDGTSELEVTEAMMESYRINGYVYIRYISGKMVVVSYES